MSHPYSGSASYIYANEYRTPTALSFDNLAPYNYYRQQSQVEFDFRIGTGKRPDASELSLNNSAFRVGYGKARAVNQTPGMMKPPGYNLSPSSQTSSLPSQTTISNAHSRNNSNHAHVHPHMHAHNYPSTHTHPQSLASSHPYSTLTATTELSASEPSHSPPALPHLYTHFHSHPHTHPHSHFHNGIPHREKSLPAPPSTPKPKLRIKTKFKLTLPNPFSFSFRLTSRSKKSPGWLSPRSPSLPQSHHSLKHSKKRLTATGRSTVFPVSSVMRDSDDDDNDPESSNWRWSATIDGPKKKRKKSSFSRLGRWLSVRGSRSSKDKPKPTTVPTAKMVSGEQKEGGLKAPQRIAREATTPPTMDATAKGKDDIPKAVKGEPAEATLKPNKSLRFGNVQTIEAVQGLGAGRKAEEDLTFTMVTV